MSKNKFRYVLIVIFSILLILQLLNYDYASDFEWISALNLLTPILMIFAMILSINDSKKQGKE